MPSSKPQSFFWYELMTTDRAAALDFYRKVVGWDAADSGIPGQSYTVLCAGPSGVGGVMELTPEMRGRGLRPCWMGFRRRRIKQPPPSAFQR